MGRYLSLLAASLLVAVTFSTESEAFLVDEWAEISTGEDASKIVVETAAPTKQWQDSFSGMEFVWVEGGCFKMGSPPRADGRDSDEQPVHSTCLSGYWMGKSEVTQAQWRSIMRSNPSKFKKGDNHPVERIGFAEAIELADRLSKMHKDKAQFRLPTEAQWEYACREGGHNIEYPGENHINKLAWHLSNSSDSTQATATRFPNRLGLYDMSGNVWEWVEDTYDRHGYSKHQPQQPLYKGPGLHQVIRGGSWREGTDALRCANRGFNKFSQKRSDLGVRLVAQINPAPPEKAPVDTNVIPF